MSVALLMRRKVIQVCDELESFFYVLLYYAIRYLKSNCTGLTIADFLDEFFDQYCIGEKGFVCGKAKLAAIQSGLLSIGSGELTFDSASPMNTLLERLLCWFKANYWVTRYTNKQKELKTQSEGKTTQSAASPTADPDPLPWGVHSTSHVPVTKSHLPSKRKSQESLAQSYVPTRAEFADAEGLSDHADVYNLLVDIAASKLWTRVDKAGDQVPADWKVDDFKGYGTTLPTIPEEISSKRQRVAGIATAPELPQWKYISTGPPVTPPRRGQTVPKR